MKTKQNIKNKERNVSEIEAKWARTVVFKDT